MLLQMDSFATKESVGFFLSGCQINSYLTLVKPIEVHLLSSDPIFWPHIYGSGSCVCALYFLWSSGNDSQVC